MPGASFTLLESPSQEQDQSVMKVPLLEDLQRTLNHQIRSING